MRGEGLLFLLRRIAQHRNNRLNANKLLSPDHARRKVVVRQSDRLTSDTVFPFRQERSMPTFAANLTTMFTEAPFPQRFSLAAQAGFTAVECLFPYALPPEALTELLEENQLQLVLFNLPAGNWEQGERGLTALPGRESEFLEGLELARAYAEAANCPLVHAMAGIEPGTDLAALERTYKANLGLAADFFAGRGIKVAIEPINRRSMPGYFLHSLQQATRCIEELGKPNLVLQFDFFHVQMEEGCVSLKFKECFPLVGHCQIAGAPERHEPDSGELNYAYIFELLDTLNYRGYVGCEYIPAGETLAGLTWFRSTNKA
jgi:hydroxypyruvate isomerase